MRWRESIGGNQTYPFEANKTKKLTRSSVAEFASLLSFLPRQPEGSLQRINQIISFIAMRWLSILTRVKVKVVMSYKAPHTMVPLSSAPISLPFAHSDPFLLAPVVPETCHTLPTSGPLSRVCLCLEYSFLNSQEDNFLTSFK